MLGFPLPHRYSVSCNSDVSILLWPTIMLVKRWSFTSVSDVIQHRWKVFLLLLLLLLLLM
jgi:hypothetical protein